VLYFPEIFSLSLVFSAEDRANDPPALARKVLNLCHCHENTLMATTPAGPLSPYIPASAPRSADVVLYLDLDGVVHHEAVLWHPRQGIYMSPYEAPDHALFEWLPILEEELAPYPSVALVLSSTWCIRPGYAKTLQRLPEQLRARFIGGTYHKRVHGADPWNQALFRSTPRGVQILADVQRRKPCHWVALDDDIEDWPQTAIGNLVACEGTTGLSDPKVRRELQHKLQQYATA